MKSLFNISIALLSLIISVSGCKKDNNDDDSTNNGFTFEGTYYETPLLIMEFVNGPYNGDIIYVIFSGGTWDANNEEIVEQKYDEFTLRVHSLEDGNLGAGSYTYMSGTSEPGTIRNPSGDCAICLGFDSNNYTCDVSSCAKSGNMTVERDDRGTLDPTDDIYTINYFIFSGDTGDKPIEGSYKGPLTFADWRS